MLSKIWLPFIHALAHFTIMLLSLWFNESSGTFVTQGPNNGVSFTDDYLRALNEYGRMRASGHPQGPPQRSDNSDGFL